MTCGFGEALGILSRLLCRVMHWHMKDNTGSKRVNNVNTKDKSVSPNFSISNKANTMVTSKKRTLCQFIVPKVSFIQRFHCMQILKVSLY